MLINAPAVSSFLVLCLLCFEFSLKQNNSTAGSTVNCQPLRSFSRVKPVGDRLHRQQTHAKVKLTGSFPDKVGDYAPVVSLQQA
jgi:hypothetical protein